MLLVTSFPHPAPSTRGAACHSWRSALVACVVLAMAGCSRPRYSDRGHHAESAPDTAGARGPTAPDAGPVATARIDIDATSNAGPARPLIGFLHDGNDPHQPPGRCADPSAVSALHPPFWRVSDPRNYQCARAAGAAVSYVLMDSYADYDPRPTPWKDWPGWEGHIRRVLSVAQARGATVDFWEPWNEPWAPAANAPLALAAFARANAVIRQAAPGAKIVAPSLAQWNERALERFFDDAVAKGQTYDAVSWHEFGEPEELSGHAARTRALLAARPSLGRPEIHVNEYATEDQHLVPAYAVAWFAALEAADVQWASRACWDGYENGRTWSDCWRGLDGLFLRDGVSRQALYWVFRGYAAMSGRRLVVAGTSAGGGASRTVALAARDDVKNEIRVLVGRYQRIVRGEVPPVTLADVTVRLTGLAPALPQASVRVERIAYQRVSGHPNAVQPLAAPQVVAPRRLPVRGGVLSIDLPALPDYEVASIVVSEQ